MGNWGQGGEQKIPLFVKEVSWSSWGSISSIGPILSLLLFPLLPLLSLRRHHLMIGLLLLLQSVFCPPFLLYSWRCLVEYCKSDGETRRRRRPLAPLSNPKNFYGCGSARGRRKEREGEPFYNGEEAAVIFLSGAC